MELSRRALVGGLAHKRALWVFRVFGVFRVFRVLGFRAVYFLVHKKALSMGYHQGASSSLMGHTKDDHLSSLLGL